MIMALLRQVNISVARRPRGDAPGRGRRSVLIPERPQTSKRGKDFFSGCFSLGARPKKKPFNVGALNGFLIDSPVPVPAREFGLDELSDMFPAIEGPFVRAGKFLFAFRPDRHPGCRYDHWH